MKLINKTKDKILTENIKELKYPDKLFGLLNKENPEAVYFKTRWGIHTAGMKFPIDIIVSDKDFKIRKIKENLKPGKIFLWNPRFNNIFELPAGVLDKTNTEIYDKIKLWN